MRHALPILLLTLAMPLQAATVKKCVDTEGHVTFTQTPCPDGTVLETTLNVENPPPSGDGPPVPLARPQAPSAEPTVIASPPPAPDPSAEPVPDTLPAIPSTEFYGYPGYGYGYRHRVRPPYIPPQWPPSPPTKPSPAPQKLGGIPARGQENIRTPKLERFSPSPHPDKRDDRGR